MTTLDAEPERLRAAIEAAREHLNHGRPTDARTRYDELSRVLDAADDGSPVFAELRARLLLGLAVAAFEVDGGLPGALAVLDDAAAEVARGGCDQLIAPLHGVRGLLLLRSGEVGSALLALDAAVLSLGAAAPYDQMTLLLNRGALHLDRGALDAAAADFGACLEIATADGHELLARKARHNLGYVDFLRGQLPRALAAMRTAEESNPGDPSPIALLDQARVLREAGLAGEADALLERVAGLFEAAGLEQDLAETELARAECAALAADPARQREAMLLAGSALARFSHRGNLRWQRRAELQTLRLARRTARDADELAEVAERTELLADQCAAEQRAGLERQARLLAAECRLRAGQPGPPSLPDVDDEDLTTRLHAREVRALALDTAGRADRALGEVRDGLAELGDYQRSFGSLDLRTASAVHGGALARLGLEVALRSGSPEAVFDVVERARAVSTRLPPVRPPDDPASAAVLAELRQAEEELRAAEGETADETAELHERVAGLQREARERAWLQAGDEDGDGDVDEADEALAAPTHDLALASVAGAGTTLVSFARDRGEWVAVVVGADASRVHRLVPVDRVAARVGRLRADLDALAMPFLPGPLRDVVRASAERVLAELDDELLAPLGLDGPLVLSCSGDLCFLPWGLLPSRRGVSTITAPSAAAWLRGLARGGRRGGPVVALAGPDLAQAADEARAVAGRWAGAVALTGQRASTEAMREALTSADLVHVAAHGRHRQDNPLFSSVRLADGPLYAYELGRGDGFAGCVVLSACDAGLATFRPGDESLGLSQVLLQLGARCVVAATARVNDEASAELMGALHARVAAGRDVAGALAEVQHELARDGRLVALSAVGGSW